MKQRLLKEFINKLIKRKTKSKEIFKAIILMTTIVTHFKRLQMIL
jgi:hypothetical protein